MAPTTGLKRKKRIEAKQKAQGACSLAKNFDLPEVKHREELRHVQWYVIQSPTPPQNTHVHSQYRDEAPRLDLPKFDRNRKHYWKFVQHFQRLVEQRVSDNGLRLIYLTNQCIGQAREAISECFGSDPDSDYAMEKEILRGLYGRDHRVITAIIDDLFKGTRGIIERVSHTYKQMSTGASSNWA